MQLSIEMKNAHLWSSTAPLPEAFASQAPFACDSMRFEQWLQFVFLPQILHLLDTQQVLPSECAILPMAEEAFKGNTKVSDLLKVIRQCDSLLNGQIL